MLKQKYFLADIFILSAEKQPIKLSWRKIEWLRLENRHAIVEALVFNFELQEHAEVQIENAQQELNFAV